MLMSKFPAILGVMAATAAIVFIDFPYMRSNRLTKEMWVFSILLLLGAGLSIAKALRLDLPTPLDAIALAFRPFSRFLSAIGLLK